MTKSGTVDQVRAALAAFEEGKKTLAELETVLAAALQSGLLTPAVAMEFLAKPVAAGVVRAETLTRLGLSKASDGTALRSPEPSSSGQPAEGPRAPSDSQPIATGQLLAGRYRLERKLGEGGMGVVYLATDQEVKGETFAIKVLTPEIRERPDALELLREEVHKTRTLAHQNIVGVYSLNVDRTNVFILMECLEGKTLQALLDEDFGRGMRFDRAWPIIEDVGAALAYAHDHSVIHGDLKPANVFVTTSGKAKLLDFGIARAARGPRRGKDAAVLGALTPAYASCEMLENVAPDARDDIYAFACMIYEMLSGRHPFGSRTAVEARDAGEKPIPIERLTDRQNAALARGLAFDRAARTATVEALIAGLAPGMESGKRRVGLSKTPWFVALLVASALALAYFTVDKFWLSRRVTAEQPSAQVATSTTSLRPTISEKSIAVLPFVDMSEKKDQEYFADGMAEEILDLLAKIPAMKVIGRTSSFQFKGKNADLRTIGTQLNAAYVLEGSVRKSGEQVRITAQLINTRTGAHEWSETYDRPIGDVLKLQDAIAAAVVRELQLTVAPADLSSRSTVKDGDAYDLVLRGRHAADRWDQDGLDAAATLFKQALDRDATFADAAAALALTYERQGEEGYVAPADAFEHARRTALIALKLDPKSALAHRVLGVIHVIYDWDWAAAEREFRQVAILAGSADAADGEALLSLALDRWDDALRQIKASLAQDPLHAGSFWVLSQIQIRRGHLPEAESAMRRALDIRPTFTWAHYYLGLVLLVRGDRNGALTEMQQEMTDFGQQQGLAIVYYALGRKADSDSALARMLKVQADTNAFGIAEVYAFRGQADEAMQWLERAYAQKDPSLYYVKGELPLTSLEENPRFKAFLRKMNLPE
jgi:TolB-like protein/predicted Ser/Thr protein kinase